MAFIGLRKPLIGKWTSDGVYEAPVAFGKAIAMDVTPNFSEAKLYADDGVDEYDKEFVDADITLGTNQIPAVLQTVMFGHTVEQETSAITFNKDDAAGYVGVGIIQPQTKSGVKNFQAMFINKAKFSEPSENWETRGDTVTYKTPSVKGKAIADGTGVWKVVQEFDTEALAAAWLKTKFTAAKPSGS